MKCTNGGSGGGNNPQISFVGNVLDSVTADDSFQDHQSGGGTVGVTCGGMCRAEAADLTRAQDAVASGQAGAVTYLNALSVLSGVGDLYALGAWGTRAALGTFATARIATTTTSTARGFNSFSAFKRHLGAAGTNRAWHHIVEQTPGNVTRFGNQAIHNTGNVVNVAHGKGLLHQKNKWFLLIQAAVYKWADSTPVDRWQII